ncbi:MAG: serine/threonine-protein phosphatase [Wenzhouxiangella sp.]|nr:serine/threonine-protein phosphatase [Wenzhouxiangella sp.]MCH8478893.1 protein phosphatase 2C domain-containing protein [Wenzhouxiangella sp.]
MSLQISSSAFTHQGHYRKRNEDACLDQIERRLWAVCDGMGGHQAGDYASQWIVRQLAAVNLSDRLGRSVQSIKCCLQDCNRHLWGYARAHQLGQIGATVVLMLIQGERVVIIWAGDSRAYRVRNGQIRQMTDDHSYAQELARATGRAPEPGQPGNEAITRAVGACESLSLDCLVMEARPGDNWMLCSDGVSGVVDPYRMEEILDSAIAPAEALVDEALQNGSRDNCTAVCVRIHGSHFRAPSSSTEYM